MPTEMNDDLESLRRKVADLKAQHERWEHQTMALMLDRTQEYQRLASDLSAERARNRELQEAVEHLREALRNYETWERYRGREDGFCE